MDIARPDIYRRKRRQRTLSAVLALAAVALITIGVSQLKPALPLVEGPVFTDTVKRGDLLRQVSGSGTLVPEEIRWITAASAGRVENIPLLPGVVVKEDTVLVELSNPELEQAAFEAESQWRGAEAQLEKIKAQLESERLTQQSLIATLKSQWTQAEIEAEADQSLLKEGLVPKLTARRTRSNADELQARHALEKERLLMVGKSSEAQARAQEAEVERLGKQYELRKRQVEGLRTRAGVAGILQRLGDDRPLQVGQQLAIGSVIARVANPSKLKAEIKVIETQARDILRGQEVSIDTRNGSVLGHVTRIDPAVQNGTVTIDVSLDGDLPRGARPDLSVEAAITLERLENVLQVGRPANSQEGREMSLFKVVDGGKRAVRTPVKLGRGSLAKIEIAGGLESGDEVVLSDMSHYDGHNQLRMK